MQEKRLRKIPFPQPGYRDFRIFYQMYKAPFAAADKIQIDQIASVASEKAAVHLLFQIRQFFVVISYLAVPHVNIDLPPQNFTV